MTLPTLGLYGLGTMGSALALNILDNGYPLHVSNRSANVTKDFVTEAGPLAEKLTSADSLVEMAQAMPAPRAIILMVPAGKPVDDSIEQLIPHLEPGDVIVDAGNADFNDTRRRTGELESRGLAFLGMGVSGGEEGARNGPSIMVGGTDSVWHGLKEVIDAIAAKFDGAPCAARLGPDGAGHFVKTVHNGIEYADMELIAEVYGLMRYGRDMEPAAIGEVFGGWNEGRLQSYLVEITAEVLAAKDSKTGEPAVDVILDRAGQKGTGRWTVIEALRMGQSASAIEAAVGARSWSAEKGTRKAGADILGFTRGSVDLTNEDLEAALLAGRVVAYAQGFRILKAASDEFEWSLDFATIAEVWRAGCIIRSSLLDEIASAFRGNLPEGQLIFGDDFAELLRSTMPALRKVVSAAALSGHAVPAFSAALGFLDTMSTARGTTDLIQGQRDRFGMHGFERLDTGETGQHGPWWD
ncbi:NADP-dependent phosphogluconate dehydrogenase [Pelagovum pacificum]|uniref:6-phosphogluconate dehydrogenase, decarboxylating n=1 Tax=Pelagovum pacificum TaxID=2588711 RepID=A0A5C5GFS3_9RHOB|nr:NADP-dependent phosphogluconate dehydrogenase [Pelagovum pacificum]QQA43494.1 NADP-dependent phosphogluconate dehydrogenase [Pelagovum pacificum]TNY33370.1 NADP-dependent phosphogluconate dehydrogenase [Pelagovum pacificum]